MVHTCTLPITDEGLRDAELFVERFVDGNHIHDESATITVAVMAAFARLYRERRHRNMLSAVNVAAEHTASGVYFSVACDAEGYGCCRESNNMSDLDKHRLIDIDSTLFIIHSLSDRVLLSEDGAFRLEFDVQGICPSESRRRVAALNKKSCQAEALLSR